MDQAKMRGNKKKYLTLPKNLILKPGQLAEDFESQATWTPVSSPAGGTLTDDAVNKKVGSNSLAMTTPAAAGYIQATKTVNFTCDGNMRFWVYLPTATLPSNILLLAGNEPSLWTNYFSASLNQGAFILRNAPGWNLINLRAGTADWATGGGAPSWSNPVQQIRIKVNTAGATTVINFDGLYINCTTQPVVVLTMDDGIDSQYTEGYLFLRKHKIRGSIYVVSDWMGTGGFLTWAQCLEMFKAGWTICNHTKDHTDLTTLNEAQQEAEFNNCESALQGQGITQRTKHVAFPSGASNANTLTALANTSMLSGRHILHYGMKNQVDNWFNLPATSEPDSTTTLATATAAIDTAIARQEVCILCMHAIQAAPSGSNWYIDRWQALINYCIAHGVPVITLDDLYRLQSGTVTIPRAV